MLKTTSLVVSIGYFELQTAVQAIYSQNLQTIPLLIVAALWYLILTSILSIGQSYLEQRRRGAARSPSGAGQPAARARPAQEHVMTRSQPMVRAEQVCKSFGSHQVLHGVDLDCRGGGRDDHRPVRLRQVHAPALHQPPGEINAGGIYVDGTGRLSRAPAASWTSCTRRGRAAAPRIGMVFQRFNLFPHPPRWRTSARRRCGSAA